MMMMMMMMMMIIIIIIIIIIIMMMITMIIMIMVIIIIIMDKIYIAVFFIRNELTAPYTHSHSIILMTTHDVLVHLYSAVTPCIM